MSEHPDRNYREDLQRDMQTFRTRLANSKDPKEQERLKKQIQSMQGMIPSSWQPDWNRSR